ncbi:hypothetical protein FACS189474_4370 [Bacteroidia bacterium]|nr:hypothetical protein FACS189474_4370 [Bacteroidia bacterium]
MHTYVFRSQNTPIVLDITPSDATEPIEWSVDRGTGAAVITQDGVLTGQVPGWVNVTAKVSSGASLTTAIAILPSTPRLDHIGSNDYLTYDFNGDRWMIQNSKEGTAIAQMYDGNPEMARGFYYTRTQSTSVNPADTPCPGDWHLPTYEEGVNLMNYVQNNPNGAAAWSLVFDGRGRAGTLDYTGTFFAWGADGLLWLAPDVSMPYAQLRQLSWMPAVRSMSQFNCNVRCVQNK